MVRHCWGTKVRAKKKPGRAGSLRGPLSRPRRPRTKCPRCKAAAMELPWVVLLAAVVSSLAARAATRLGLLGRAGTPPSTRAARRGPARDVKVLFACPARAAWRETLLHLLRQARDPRGLRFGVLLECATPEDADSVAEVDSELRGVARVALARAPRDSRDAARRTRRLLRRFVEDDEGTVVVVDYRVRVAPGWDDVVAAALLAAPSGALVSAPAAPVPGGPPGFPTRARGAGGATRGPTRAFAATGAAAVPSACWCAEATAGRPAALRAAFREDARRAYLRVPGPHYVPTNALVEADEVLVAELRAADAGCAESACGRAERAGITPDDDDASRILKYGSSRAARMAVEFA